MAEIRTRPKFLNPLQIKLPVVAVLSILHRITGVLLFAGALVAVWLLNESVSGPQGYARTVEMLGSLPARLALALVGWALAHHFLAGIRFLLIDIDIGVEKATARSSAWVVNVLAALIGVALLIGGVA